MTGSDFVMISLGVLLACVSAGADWRIRKLRDQRDEARRERDLAIAQGDNWQACASEFAMQLVTANRRLADYEAVRQRHLDEDAEEAEIKASTKTVKAQVGLTSDNIKAFHGMWASDPVRVAP